MTIKKTRLGFLLLSLLLSASIALATGIQKNTSIDYKEAFLTLCLNPTASQRYTLEKWAERDRDKYSEKFCQQTARDFFEKNIKSISLPQNASIKDVSPFQYFTNIKSLDFSYNKIDDISILFRLVKLKQINIDKNNISNISVLSNFTELEDLTISSNPITDISVLANLSELKSLSFYATSFTNLSALRSLKKLQHLAFSHGEFKAANDKSYLNNPSLRDEISHMTNLKSLFIHQVPLIDLCALAPLTQLNTLTLARVNISNINCLASYKDLDVLNLLDNPIQDLGPLAQLKKLRILEIKSVPAKSIQPLAKLEALNLLYIDHSGVEDASPISGRPDFSSLSTEGTHLRWCSPKDAKDVQKGISCLEPDGSEKPWWKRLLRW